MIFAAQNFLKIFIFLQNIVFTFLFVISFGVELVGNLHVLVAEVLLPEMVVRLGHRVVHQRQFRVNLVEMQQLVQRLLVIAEREVHLRFHKQRVCLRRVKL
jgi:hypothetical protein